jgi:hypothetical protein
MVTLAYLNTTFFEDTRVLSGIATYTEDSCKIIARPYGAMHHLLRAVAGGVWARTLPLQRSKQTYASQLTGHSYQSISMFDTGCMKNIERLNDSEVSCSIPMVNSHI